MYRIYIALRQFEVYCAAACLTIVIGLVTWATVTRFLSVPNVWVIEVTQIFFAWACTLSGSIAFRRSSHFSVDFLTGYLPQGSDVWIALVQNLVVLVLVLGVAWVALDFVQLASRRPLPLTRIPFSWVAASIPVAFTLIGMTCIENILNLLANRPAPDARGES